VKSLNVNIFLINVFILFGFTLHLIFHETVYLRILKQTDCKREELNISKAIEKRS